MGTEQVTEIYINKYSKIFRVVPSFLAPKNLKVKLGKPLLAREDFPHFTSITERTIPTPVTVRLDKRKPP